MNRSGPRCPVPALSLRSDGPPQKPALRATVAAMTDSNYPRARLSARAERESWSVRSTACASLPRWKANYLDVAELQTPGRPATLAHDDLLEHLVPVAGQDSPPRGAEDQSKLHGRRWSGTSIAGGCSCPPRTPSPSSTYSGAPSMGTALESKLPRPMVGWSVRPCGLDRGHKRAHRTAAGGRRAE